MDYFKCSLKTFLLLCVAFIGQSLTAQEFVGNGIRYERIDTTFEARVLGFANPPQNSILVIPETVVNGSMSFTVTGIADQAFMNSPISFMTSLTLPSSITNIGNGAFLNCPIAFVTYLGATEPNIGSSAFTLLSNRTVSLPNASGGFTPELWGVTPIQIQYGGTGQAIYTVTFNYYASELSNTTQQVESGQLLKKPQDPVRQNYIFEGWFRGNVGASNLVYLDEWNFATDTVSANITLYAKWTLDDGTRKINGITYRIQSAGATGGATIAVVESFDSQLNPSTNIVIPSSIIEKGIAIPVTEIKLTAFMGNQQIVSLTIPASVTTISGSCFITCTKLASITYLGTTDPITIVATKSFPCPNRVLYVPNATTGFEEKKDFWGVKTVVYGGQAPVVQERTETTATVTWNLVEGAVSYYLYLYSDAAKETLIATYEFDAEGNPVLRSSSVPTFNITGLDFDADYYVEVEAKNEKDETLLIQTTTIPTLEEYEALTSIKNAGRDAIKIHSSHGTIFIEGLKTGDQLSIINSAGRIIHSERAEKSTFTIPLAKGIYIIKTPNKTFKNTIY